MGRTLKIASLIIILIGIVIQFYRPDKSEFISITLDDFLLYERAPKNVKVLIKNSCYDCHSNQTNYVWFDQIAPLSWTVDDHINDAKKKLNLSEWATMDYRDKRKALSLMATNITENKMPLKSYVILHKDSKLSETDKKEVLKWLFTIEINN